MDWYPVVCWLLLSPVPTVFDLALPPAALPAIQRRALELDLVDEIDRRSDHWTCWGSPQFELGWCREALWECRDAPPSVQAYLLPTVERCQCMLSLADGHLVRLEAWEPDLAESSLEDTRRRRHVWSLARDARHDGSWGRYRRQAMEALYEQIGPAAFYSGRLPPPVSLDGKSWPPPKPKAGDIQ